MERIILLIVSSIIMVSGLLMISYFSIFGLHAKAFSILPKPDIFDCELQSLNENILEQFNLNEPEIITCMYKCKDSNGNWYWVEKTKDIRGCPYLKRMYKTEIFGDKND